MECATSPWHFLSYPICDYYSLKFALQDWLNLHAQQILLLAIGMLVIVGVFGWQRGWQLAGLTPDQRAEQLLKQSLTPHQYKQLLFHGFLDLPSPTTSDEFYRIPRWRGRIKVYETYQSNEHSFYRLKAEMCILPCEKIPDADLVLANKWMIEGDEKTYLAIANWKWLANKEWNLYTTSPAATQS